MPSNLRPEHLELMRKRAGAAEISEAAWFIGVWYANYYHWMINYLPRLKALRANDWRGPVIGPSTSKLDEKPFLSQCLSILEIDRRELLPAPEQPLRIGRLMLIESDGIDRNLLQDLRNAMPCRASASPGRMLYVQRGEVWKRRVLDEDVLSRRLAAIGFDIIDCARLTVDRQLALFAESRLVVAIHGAALANIIACPKKATIIELADPIVHPNPLYYELASELSLSYACLQTERVDNGQRANDWDYRVDPDQLIHKLTGLGLL